MWDDDKKCGMGVEYYPDGSYYDGEWYDGVKHGQGVFKNANGVKLDKRYRRGDEEEIF